MKTRLICAQCSADSGGVGVFFIKTIRQDGLYTGKCPKGHDLFVATQTLRHEMLFEIALNAIADGYYREGVSSFASSVERFFEFAVRVLLNKSKTPQNAIEEAWRNVSSQSERQYGAYVFLYTATFGAMPTVLPPGKAKFRNDVIHKGELPERSKALEFGKACYEVIQSGVQKLRAACLDEVNKVLGEHVAEIVAKMGSQYPRAFQLTPTALNIIEDISQGYKPFDQIANVRGQ